MAIKPPEPNEVIVNYELSETLSPQEAADTHGIVASVLFVDRNGYAVGAHVECAFGEIQDNEIYLRREGKLEQFHPVEVFVDGHQMHYKIWCRRRRCDSGKPHFDDWRSASRREEKETDPAWPMYGQKVPYQEE